MSMRSQNKREEYKIERSYDRIVSTIQGLQRQVNVRMIKMAEWAKSVAGGI